LLSAVGAGVLIILGGWMMSIFNNDAAVVQHGRHYLWMAAVAGPCYVLLNIAGSVFLAAARYGLLLTVNALRLIVVPLVFCWLLAIVLDWGGAWCMAGTFCRQFRGCHFYAPALFAAVAGKRVDHEGWMSIAIMIIAFCLGGK
ncbi:MAG: hypothetical protein ACR2PV_04530, partial [Gammaproteobacteria bacterium]